MPASKFATCVAGIQARQPLVIQPNPTPVPPVQLSQARMPGRPSQVLNGIAVPPCQPSLPLQLLRQVSWLLVMLSQFTLSVISLLLPLLVLMTTATETTNIELHSHLTLCSSSGNFLLAIMDVPYVMTGHELSLLPTLLISMLLLPLPLDSLQLLKQVSCYYHVHFMVCLS